MRVALVSPRYAPFVGGVETHVERLAVGLVAAGHSVDVFTHRHEPGLPPLEEMAGVRVRRFAIPVPSDNFALSPSLALNLARRARTYDVVHAHAYHALPALWAAFAPRSKLIFTPHYHGTGHSPFRQALHPIYRPFGGLILRRSRRVIAVSEAERLLILGHFPSARDKTLVIPNGVDREAVDHAIPFPEERRVILSAGRLESYKHVDRAIEAMRYLPDHYVLRVLGDGPEHGALDAQALAADPARDRIQVLGRVPRDELYRWFRTASVYVSLSTNEAMPVTIVETLAAGAAIVASDIPAHREIASGPGAGAMILVPPSGPVEEVAHALDRSVRARIAGELPHAPVASWSEVVERTLAVYRA